MSSKIKRKGLLPTPFKHTIQVFSFSLTIPTLVTFPSQLIIVIREYNVFIGLEVNQDALWSYLSKVRVLLGWKKGVDVGWVIVSTTNNTMGKGLGMTLRKKDR